ncbi:hypothetical protein ACSBL2_09280 [Pedobacter sp. AW31-3R]|uniref:hypothetical protein n=1 Tax=Pedobacter sp. AW31-3R TaxID=3445781 RepID=UPI003F9FE578
MKNLEVTRINLRELVVPNSIEEAFLITNPIDGDCSCARGRNENARNASTADEDLIF